MSTKIKFDPKYFYTFKNRRYERQSDLTDQACKSGKHKWEITYSFGKYKCTICGALREVRPDNDTVLRKKLKNSTNPRSVNNPTFNRVVKSIERFNPSRTWRKELSYQIELQGWLKQEFPTANIEKTTGASRPDIVIDNIAIEVKGPTGNSELGTLSEKCLKYSEHYKNLAIVLFEPKFTEQRYSEIETGIKKYFPHVRIVRKD